jgi:hypothetical protein
MNSLGRIDDFSVLKQDIKITFFGLRIHIRFLSFETLGGDPFQKPKSPG